MFLSPSEYLPVSRFLCLSFCFSEHHCFWVSVWFYPQPSESLVSALAVSLDPFGSLSPSVPVSRSLSGLPIPGSLCLCRPLGSAPLGPPHPVTLAPRVPHRIVAAFGAAAFSHFFLFLRLLLSSLAARKLCRGLGRLPLAGVFGVPPGLGGPLRSDLCVALRDRRRRGPQVRAAPRPHGR